MIGRSHNRFQIGGAAKLEIFQGQTADRALLNDPGDRAMQPFFQQDIGHQRRYAKAEIDRLAIAQCHGGAPGDYLGYAPIHRRETAHRLGLLATDGGFIGRLRGLHLFGIERDMVDQGAGHADGLRRQAAIWHHALDLGDDDAAIVARRQCLVQRSQIRAFVLHGQVAIFIGCRAADDGHINRDRLVEEPLLAGEVDARHDVVPRDVVHLAATMRGVNDRIPADLAKQARAPGSRLAVHVIDDAAGQVVGFDLVLMGSSARCVAIRARKDRWGRSRRLPA